MEKGLDRGDSVHSIAQRLRRSPSTIYREIQRTRWRPSNTSAAYRPVKVLWRRTGHLTDLEHRASVAQATPTRQAVNSHQPTALACDERVDFVIDHLRQGWTPQMIAERCRADLPGTPTRMACHETIYQFIYSRQGRSRHLSDYLPLCHKTRRHRHGRRVNSSHIPYRVSIGRRPPEVDDRTQFGHGEGDTVEGRAHTTGIHTDVERTTQFLATHIVDTVTSQATLDAQRSIFAPLPPKRHTPSPSTTGTRTTAHTCSTRTPYPSTTATPTAPTNAAPTNTSTGSSDATCPKAPTWPTSPNTTSTTSPTTSTTTPSNASAGPPPTKPSTDI